MLFMYVLRCMGLRWSLLLQISVTAGCGVIAFLMSDLTYYTDSTKYPATCLSSPLLPILVSLLVGYTVAQCFFNVSLFMRPCMPL